MSLAEPQQRLWTVEEYYRAAEAGVFDPAERLELIDGEILRMSPQNSPHATAVGLAQDLLPVVFGSEFMVRVQLPLSLGAASEPEPDIAVVRGRRREYTGRHPRQAVLVMEVSESSIAHDLRRKASLYARSGISEYWVLVLSERALGVHRNPDPAAGHYSSVTRIPEHGTISPVAAPTAAVPIADLLP